MKKAFAVMSTLMIALACFGLFSKTTVAAAEDKTFVVDPTLAEDEDPMYIMDSIYTTFPHYYRNSEKLDDKWQGASRMYPWNETRLRVQKYDLETGEATGRYYAVYFSGALKHMEGNEKVYGVGDNVLFYTFKTEKVTNEAGEEVEQYVLDENGNKIVQLSRKTRATWYHNRNAYDPSLSHMNTNGTGEDIFFNMDDIFAAVKDDADPGRMYNQILVFDGQGRAIRGSASENVFYEEGAEKAAQYLLPAVFCYVDGKVVKYVPGETIPDKKEEAKLDENGEPVLDENGEPVMVETDEDHMLYRRFTWAWFEEKPENVNEVGYLEEGWDHNKWDFCFPQDGGYMCYALMGPDGDEEFLTAEELEFYNAQQKAAYIAANGSAEGFKEAAEKTIKREVITNFYIPAGGWTYDFGYLDKGTAILNDFHQMFIASYYYGRSEGYAEQRTYNFSSSGLLTEDVVYDGNGYRVIENNVIEVMPNTVVNPSKNVIYTGLTRYWDKGEDGTGNDLNKFVADTSVCEFFIKVNGATVVMPPQYKDLNELTEDFINDWNTYAVEVLKNEAKKITVKPAIGHETEISSGTKTVADVEWFDKLGWDFAGLSESDTAFTAKYAEKWGWLFEYMYIASGKLACMDSEKLAKGATSSPGSFRACVWGFFAGSPKVSHKNQGANTGCDWTGSKSASDWNVVVEWADYTFTTSEELDAKYDVEYTVKNTATGNESTITITYIVTDVYTPFIELNDAALNVKSEMKDGKVVINNGEAITAAQLLKAYSGKYSKITGVDADDINGREITYKVVLDSETLDFDNPTEGKHSVVARVVAQSANTYKEALERFTVVIRDRTNPVVTVASETINVAYGSTFDPQIGILAASDNVDGNLKLAAHTWCVDLSETSVNTTKPGTYTVVLGIYDSAGNNKQVSYKVKVAEAYANAEQVGEVADIAEENGYLLAELQEALNGLLAKVNELSTKKGCGKSSAALAVQILSASSLLVLVLRKKH